MRIRCYQSWADSERQERLWNLIDQGRRGWISVAQGGPTLWYIPEELVAWALLIDSDLRPRPKSDWII